MYRSLKVLLPFLVLLLGAADALAYKKIKCFMPQAPEISLEGVTKIALLDFSAANPADREVGKFISDKMIEYLLQQDRGITAISGGLFRSSDEGQTLVEGVSTQCFELVERSRLEAIMAEQSIGAAGMVSDSEAARLGELAGVDVILIGDVSTSNSHDTFYETHTRYQNKQQVNYQAQCEKRKVGITAGMRIVHASTGQILSAKKTGNGAEDKHCNDESGELKSAAEMLGACAVGIAAEFVNTFNPWYALEEFELEKIKVKEGKDEADDAAKFAEDLEMDRAYAIYNKLFLEDSYNPRYLYNMGVLYEVTGDFTRAKEMYEGAVTLKDEKKFKEALERITKRVALVPFYSGLNMAIQPYDFEAAAADPSLTAKKVKIKGGSHERFDIYAAGNPSSEVVAKVPGEIQLEIIAQEGDWFLVKLPLGGKQGYIHKDKVD